MDTNIIHLNRSHQTQIAEVLAQAFATYPLMTYIYAPSKVSISDSLHAMFTMSGEIRMTFDWPMLGALDDTGKLVGTALLNMPGESEWPESLQQLHDRKFKQVVGPESVRRLADFNKLADTGRPEEPTINLGVIGVLPEMQGKGYGGQLLEEVSALSEAHPTSTGVWLDTETEHNVHYYQKFGYEVKAHTTLDGEVDIWCMFRENGK